MASEVPYVPSFNVPPHPPTPPLLVAHDPYAAAEVCQHAFAYDTGVCMACGVSAQSARLAKKPKPAIPADSLWDKLKTEFDQCEAVLDREGDLVGVNPIPPGMKVNGFTKEEIYPSAPMTKTEAQLHHLTSVFGSREKALDAWKAAHLGARAIKNNREHADYLDACDMEREIDELSAAQELQHAMSRPLATEKSMRAQLLLRDDD